MMANGHFIRQAGAIPLRGGRMCLITSRNGKRWVIPKGLIEPGHAAGETALVEAWEEAGLTGTLDPEPIGSYVYDKDGSTYHVTVFVMRVTDVAQDWQERDFRQRIFVSPAGAMRRVDDLGLAKLLRAALALESPVIAAP